MRVGAGGGVAVRGSGQQRSTSSRVGWCSMTHRIVVLGAGYAGANAAGRLARWLHPADVEITLANADLEFVERVRMHQLAAGQELKSRVLTDVFADTGVRVQPARVTAVDADRKTVDIVAADGSREIAYDTLVYALGSAAADCGVPGVAEHAYDIAGKQSALRMRERLASLGAGVAVLVVGGGLTGIEAATEIAEARPDLEVALAARGGLGDWLSEKAQQHLRKAFDRLGISVHENTEIARVQRTGAVTIDGRTIPAQMTVWTAGFAVHPIAAATTLQVSATGQIVVDDTMRSVSHPDVYAVGDAALAPGANGDPLRMSCASGVPTAYQAADPPHHHRRADPRPYRVTPRPLWAVSDGQDTGLDHTVVTFLETLQPCRVSALTSSANAVTSVFFILSHCIVISVVSRSASFPILASKVRLSPLGVAGEIDALELVSESGCATRASRCPSLGNSASSADGALVGAAAQKRTCGNGVPPCQSPVVFDRSPAGSWCTPSRLALVGARRRDAADDAPIEIGK
ncbi:FAD-dependent oxidoreductase [Nocardia sp. NPDC050793]|uniref:NAD(P)/FAD-dependent oxidoreductase n=1 Tax=Nocardia sp. NPDC050793 TaxID=3155159 RepID=UPI0033F59D1E